jgi:rhodanese-related sulfurtransferase
MKNRNLMIRSLAVLVILAILVGSTACGNSTTQGGSNTPAAPPSASASMANLKNVSTVEGYDLVNKNSNNPDFIIMDVRTPAEYQSGHLANAVNVDIYAQDFESRLGQMDKDLQYLVYCQTGVRSAQASKTMSELGFTHIFNMLLGIGQWIADGHPTTS